VHHDRNRNAATNILVKGQLELGEGKPTTGEAKVREAVVNKDFEEILSMAGVGCDPLLLGILSLSAGSVETPYFMKSTP
jgi:hypothetical protein